MRRFFRTGRVGCRLKKKNYIFLTHENTLVFTTLSGPDPGQQLSFGDKAALNLFEASETNVRLAVMGQEPVLMHLRNALHAAKDPEKQAVVGALLGVRLAERAPRSSSAIRHLRQALSLTTDKELRTYIELYLARLDESARGEHLAAAQRSEPNRRASVHVELEAARQARGARDGLEHIVRAERLADDEDTREYMRALRLPDILRKSLYAMQSKPMNAWYRSDVPSE